LFEVWERKGQDQKFGDFYMPKARNSAAAAKQLGPGEAARDITKPRDLPAGGNGQLSGDAQKGPGSHKQMHATSKEQQDLKMKTKKVSFAGQVSRDVAEVAVSSFNQQRSCRDTPLVAEDACQQGGPSSVTTDQIVMLAAEVMKNYHAGCPPEYIKWLWMDWWSACVREPFPEPKSQCEAGSGIARKTKSMKRRDRKIILEVIRGYER